MTTERQKQLAKIAAEKHALSLDGDQMLLLMQLATLGVYVCIQSPKAYATVSDTRGIMRDVGKPRGKKMLEVIRAVTKTLSEKSGIPIAPHDQ